MREDEMDITIRVSVRSEYTKAMPGSADGIDPPVAAEIDIHRVEWLQDLARLNIHGYLTQEQLDYIKDAVELEVEMGR